MRHYLFEPSSLSPGQKTIKDNQITSRIIAFIISFTILCSCLPVESFQTSSQNNTKIGESIKEVDPCLLKSVYSFLYSSSSPPTTTEQLTNSCRSQSEGFKCVREKSRGIAPILRRGLLTYISGRQKYHKKYCTNVNSELSQKFVKDLSCIMNKKRGVYKRIDSDFANTLIELINKNFDDSKIELKYLCCSLINYRKVIIDSVGPECTSSKAQVEEMIMSIIPNDINLICEDEDKLNAKVCPTLEPVKIPETFNERTGSSPSATTLYLIATLETTTTTTTVTTWPSSCDDGECNKNSFAKCSVTNPSVHWAVNFLAGCLVVGVVSVYFATCILIEKSNTFQRMDEQIHLPVQCPSYVTPRGLPVTRATSYNDPMQVKHLNQD